MRLRTLLVLFGCWCVTAAQSGEPTAPCGLLDDSICVGPETLPLGNFHTSAVDIDFQGRAPAVRLSRAYNSRGAARSGVFGPGWTAGYLDIRFSPDAAPNEKAGEPGLTAELSRADGGVEHYMLCEKTPPMYLPVAPADQARVNIRKLPEGGWALSDLRGPLWLFDTAGRLTAIEDGYGNDLIIKRDSDGFPLLLRGVGGEIQFSRDAKRPMRIGAAIAAELRWTYEYDAAGRLIRVVPPGHDEAIQGPLATYHYGAADRLARVDFHPTDAARRLALSYNEHGWLTQMAGPGPRRLNWTYHLAAPPSTASTVRITDADGIWTEYVTQPALGRRIVREPGLPELVFEQRGELSRIFQGEPLHPLDAKGASLDDLRLGKHGGRLLMLSLSDIRDPIEQWFDRSGQVRLRMSDPALGLPTAAIDAGGAARWEYDLWGGLLRETFPDGAWRRFELDRGGGVRRVEASDAPGTDLIRDEQGLVAETISGAARHRRRFGYDSFGRVIDLPGGLRLARDAVGNTSQVTQGDHPVVTVATDAQGRTVRRAVGRRATTVFEHDASGLLRSIAVPGLTPHRLDYTPAGRLAALHFADGTAKRFAWNSDGRIEKVVARNGIELTRQYDEFGRLKAMESAERRLSLRYDTADRIVRATVRDAGTNALMGADGAFDTHRIFNAKGNLLSEYQSGHVVSYRYDALGRRSALTYPDGSEITYEYEPLCGRTSAMQGPWCGRVEFQYDSDGRLSGTRYAAINTSVSRTYDETGRVATIRVTRGDQTTWLYTAARNALGQTIREQDSLKWERSYTHDSAGWLKQADGSDLPTALYTYDDAGNLRNTRPGEPLFQIDSGGLIAKTAGRGLGSHAGNTTVFAPKEPNRDVHLAYDAEGRLTSSDGVIRLTYGYDGFDRLVAALGSGGAGFQRVYDGWNLITETRSDASGAMQTTRVLYGFGEDQLLAMHRDGQLYFFVQDPRNSVVLLLDQRGTIASRIAYSPWGEVTSSTGSVLPPLGFCAAPWDENAGVYHMRMRAYAPRLGRFLQPDPTDFAGGENLYAYAGNAPLEFIDPSGMGVQDWAARIVNDPGSNPLTRFGATLVGAGAMVLAGEGETRIEKYGEAANTVGSIIETAGDIVSVAHPALTPWGTAIAAEGKLFKAGADVLKGQVTLDTVSNLASGATGVYGTIGKVAGRVTAAVDGLSAGKDVLAFSDTGDATKLASATFTVGFGAIKNYTKQEAKAAGDALKAAREEAAAAFARKGEGAVDELKAAAVAASDAASADLYKKGADYAAAVAKFGLKNADKLANEVLAIERQSAEIDEKSRELGVAVTQASDRLGEVTDQADAAWAAAVSLESESELARRAMDHTRQEVQQVSGDLSEAARKRDWLQEQQRSLEQESASTDSKLKRAREGVEKLATSIESEENALAEAARRFADDRLARAEAAAAKAAADSRSAATARQEAADDRRAAERAREDAGSVYDTTASASPTLSYAEQAWDDRFRAVVRRPRYRSQNNFTREFTRALQAQSSAMQRYINRPAAPARKVYRPWRSSKITGDQRYGVEDNSLPRHRTSVP